MFHQVMRTVGGPVQRRKSKAQVLLQQINSKEPEYVAMTDDEIRRASLSLRYRAKSQEPLPSLLVEAYALAREAAKRRLKMRHFDVQILGGIAMSDKCVAEMQTGEGKTLTAILPCYLHALSGRGAQLATSNDYLAERDADILRPVYSMLGMTIGVVKDGMQPPDRRKAYHCDVTYGTSKEFGFDFLRDRLLLRSISEGHSDRLGRMLGQTSGQGGDQPVQRDPYFILVDEADSILIDEARTPLIISALPGEEEKIQETCFLWAAKANHAFEQEKHFTYDHEKRSYELTAKGRQLARAIDKPPETNTVSMYHIYEYIERAIRVEREYNLDQQFVVKDEEVVIVDEMTGRLAEGRKWRDGIHQAVEAKTGVKVSVDAGQAARVTVQDFFMRYEKIGGMTGTARSSASEFKKVYGLQVVPIPTNKPGIRLEKEAKVYGSEEMKFQAILDEVLELNQIGRPVLIGTRSIDKSEDLSKLFKASGIDHQVLNARHHAEEAGIVAKAGELGRVTVATNMAGRGTDIKLSEEVHELGGLHVICTEILESARVDRQLIGRCGRQGDPGSFRMYSSLDDELLKVAFGPKKSTKYKSVGKKAKSTINQFLSLFYRAQKKVEKKHFRDRKVLLYYEKQRKKMQIQMGQDPYLDTPT